jgi:hypothetical protein
VDCQTFGSQTYCSDGTSYQRFGNTVYQDDHNSKNSWTTYGSQTSGTDGTSYQRFGNTVYEDKSGTSWTTYGNVTYGTDGSTYERFGNVTYGEGGRGLGNPVVVHDEWVDEPAEKLDLSFLPDQPE